MFIRFVDRLWPVLTQYHDIASRTSHRFAPRSTLWGVHIDSLCIGFMTCDAVLVQMMMQIGAEWSFFLALAVFWILAPAAHYVFTVLTLRVGYGTGAGFLAAALHYLPAPIVQLAFVALLFTSVGALLLNISHLHKCLTVLHAPTGSLLVVLLIICFIALRSFSSRNSLKRFMLFCGALQLLFVLGFLAIRPPPRLFFFRLTEFPFMKPEVFYSFANMSFQFVLPRVIVFKEFSAVLTMDAQTPEVVTRTTWVSTLINIFIGFSAYSCSAYATIAHLTPGDPDTFEPIAFDLVSNNVDYMRSQWDYMGPEMWNLSRYVSYLEVVCPIAYLVDVGGMMGAALGGVMCYVLTCGYLVVNGYSLFMTPLLTRSSSSTMHLDDVPSVPSPVSKWPGSSDDVTNPGHFRRSVSSDSIGRLYNASMSPVTRSGGSPFYPVSPSGADAWTPVSFPRISGSGSPSGNGSGQLKDSWREMVPKHWTVFSSTVILSLVVSLALDLDDISAPDLLIYLHVTSVFLFPVVLSVLLFVNLSPTHLCRDLQLSGKFATFCLLFTTFCTLGVSLCATLSVIIGW